MTEAMSQPDRAMHLQKANADKMIRAKHELSIWAKEKVADFCLRA
jgi:hypothetical protein